MTRWLLAAAIALFLLTHLAGPARALPAFAQQTGLSCAACHVGSATSATTRFLAATCLIMLMVFIAAYNFQIALALVTSNMVAGNSQTYGTLMSTLGFGAATGSLMLARQPRVGLHPILVYTTLLAIAQLAVAAAHTVPLALAASFAYGLGAALFSVTVIGTLQTRTAEDMRGRVMALYSICFLGSSPIGGPSFAALAGWIGVSRALCVTAAICAATALIGAIAWRTRISLQKHGNPALSVD